MLVSVVTMVHTWRDLSLHGVGEGLGVLEGEESFFSAINRDALVKVNLEYVFPQRMLLDLRIVVAFQLLMECS